MLVHPLKLNSFILFKLLPYVNPESILSLNIVPSNINDSRCGFKLH